MAVVCDFGIFEKPTIDPERIAFGYKQVSIDLGTSPKDIE
jgi:hypothetical protein